MNQRFNSCGAKILVHLEEGGSVSEEGRGIISILSPHSLFESHANSPVLYSY